MFRFNLRMEDFYTATWDVATTEAAATLVQATVDNKQHRKSFCFGWVPNKMTQIKLCMQFGRFLYKSVKASNRRKCDVTAFAMAHVACFLHCRSHIGSTLLPGAAEVFYKFMTQREVGRVRKEVLGLPRQKWYSGVWESMAAIRLTNVRRTDDATTQLVSAVCRPAAHAWHRSDCLPWQHRMLGLFVFHCALWRTFGARAFITERGFNFNVFS